MRAIGRSLGAGEQQPAYVADAQVKAGRGSGHIEGVAVEQARMIGAEPGGWTLVPGRRELLTGKGVAAVEDGTEVLRVDLAGEADLRCERSDPTAGRFTMAGVVVLGRAGDLADVVVGRTGSEPPDVQHESGPWVRSMALIRPPRTPDRDNLGPLRSVP